MHGSTTARSSTSSAARSTSCACPRQAVRPPCFGRRKPRGGCCCFLPHCRAAAACSSPRARTNCTTADLWVLDLESGDARVLLPGERQGGYLHSGHVAYVARDGQVFAAPFDLKALAFRGTPVPVLGGVARSERLRPEPHGVVHRHAGDGGRQRDHRRIGGSGIRWCGWTGRATQRPVDSAWTFRLTQNAGNVGWALSPDGTRLAIGLNTDSGDDIWIKELPAGPLSRLTFDSTDDSRPRWTPDGRSVMYVPSHDRAAPAARRRDGRHRDRSQVHRRRNDRRSPQLARRPLAGVPQGRGDGRSSAGGTSSASGRAWTARPCRSWPSPAWTSRRPRCRRTGSGSPTCPTRPAATRSTCAPSPPPTAASGRSPPTAARRRSGPTAAASSSSWTASATWWSPPCRAAPPSSSAPAASSSRSARTSTSPAASTTPRSTSSPDDQRFIMAREVRRAADRARTFVLVENWFEELKAKVKP